MKDDKQLTIASLAEPQPQTIQSKEDDDKAITDYWSLVIVFGIAGLWVAQNSWRLAVTLWEKSPFVQEKDAKDKVNALLYRILDLVDCDRVVVIIPRKKGVKRKHKGNCITIHKENREPLGSWVISIDYEALKPGVASAKLNFQNVQLSEMKSIIHLAENENIIYRKDVPAEVKDPHARRYALENGIKSSIAIVMGDYHDPEIGCVGILGIHFLNYQPDKIKEFDSSLIMKHVHELEGLLLSLC